MAIRRKLAAALAATTLLVSGAPALAADVQPLSFYVNGRELYLPQTPILQENRVLVPMRAYLESLGAEVGWEPPNLVTARMGEHTVSLRIGQYTAQVDGREVPLDVPAQIIADRTYVPLRFLSEGLGAEVGYDGATRTVTVVTAPPGQLEVIDGPLNVRAEPSTTAPILTTVPVGTRLDIVSEQPGAEWTQVALPGGTLGWVANRYTRTVGSEPVVQPLLALLEQRAYLQAGGQCIGAVPLVNNLTYVPLVEAVEALGGSVRRAGDGTAIAAELGGRQLLITPDSATATLNGQAVALSAAPLLVGGRPLIPARDLADHLGVTLSWSDATRTVTLGPAGGTTCIPDIAAQAYILVDVATGAVLSEYNARAPRAIASTTKIMTALLAVEQGHPDAVVTVSANAASQPGTSVYLRAGEQRTLRELLYGLMLVSGNDAAVAIAEHLAGSEEAFARRMNLRAAELGAQNTYFVTASGLDDDVNPYSTAEDLARISLASLRNPLFRSYMYLPQATIPGPWGNRQLTNSNLFVLRYPGATGVKNGWTEKAGYTLVASAWRDGREVMLVLLGGESRSALYAEAYSLMDHGFVLADHSWLLR
ncbi:stalk domain-containing protein [Symbiobacterium thermophilum]|uniref:stalk domain-containing protein n=1 Tax=Symbiobacterium thermophilum TaxID=2734 RepID=UPI0035C77E63